VANEVDGKEIRLLTSGSVQMEETFSAAIHQGTGVIRVDSDMTGLQ
jgi:hypothetical protein